MKKRSYLVAPIFVFSFGSLLSSSIYASDSSPTYSHKVSIGGSSTNLTWEEFDAPTLIQPEETRILKEDGNISGFHAAYEFQTTNCLWDLLKGCFARAELDIRSGTIDYAGSTTGGASFQVTSETDYSMTDFSVRAGLTAPDNADHPKIYIGFGQHSRDRDINDTTDSNNNVINGLDESYSWTYGLIGSSARIFNSRDERFNVHAGVEYLKPFSPSLDVVMSNTLNYADVSLGTVEQYRFAFTFAYQIMHDWELALIPSYTKTNVARSDLSTLFNSDGSDSGNNVSQPKSRSDEITFRLEVSRYF